MASYSTFVILYEWLLNVLHDGYASINFDNVSYMHVGSR